MVNIVGVTGLAGAGKDTVANILCDKHGYKRVAFADPLKEMAAAFCGEPLELFHSEAGKAGSCAWLSRTRREILQLLGTECVKPHFGADVWVKRLFGRITSGALGDRVVITDVRFNPEAQAILAAGGIILKVERPGRALKGSEAAHVSEAGIDPDMVDITLVNDSTISHLASEIEDIAHLLERNA